MMKAESWKPVEDFEGLYEVSDLGNVRSVDRVVVDKKGVRRKVKGRVLMPTWTVWGYAQAELSKGNKRFKRYVHHLVYVAFIGPRPDGKEMNHIDGMKTNNVPSNLEFVTRAEHVKKSAALGQVPKGDTHFAKTAKPAKRREWVRKIKKGLKKYNLDKRAEERRQRKIERENPSESTTCNVSKLKGGRRQRVDAVLITFEVKTGHPFRVHLDRPIDLKGREKLVTNAKALEIAFDHGTVVLRKKKGTKGITVRAFASLVKRTYRGKRIVLYNARCTGLSKRNYPVWKLNIREDG